MLYGLSLPNFAPFDDARLTADLARAGEDAGWDGVFVWDHVTWLKDDRLELADPWVLLTAVALATSRVRLGAMVTPLARRRMSVLARQTTTLDRLSGGRLVQGVGLGWPVQDEFGTFGESTDERELAGRLDESLEVLTRLWSGEEVEFAGEHLTVDRVAFRPTPVQRPRVPVWVAGQQGRARPLRRAARWDGYVPIAPDQPEGLRPAQTAEIAAAVAELRPAGAGPFDLVVNGESGSPAEAADQAGTHAEAGATWWHEAVVPWRGMDTLRARIAAGPAR
jgi:alkanesulfonate monooxygenase SsuD/methylene tetrahydromethanopterin reductase-like flavin-dependent oxidoreductase (luciferase family)